MIRPELPAVRCAGVGEARAAARLLVDFNREFDEPTPPIADLAGRIAHLLEGGDTVVLLIGDEPEGLAVLRFRPAIWSVGLECYLAELYVVPSRRGHGLGRTLMEAALEEARRRGADTMEIGVDEPDLAARNLYESLGFTNRVGGTEGPVMYVYERDLHDRAGYPSADPSDVSLIPSVSAAAGSSAPSSVPPSQGDNVVIGER